MPGQLIALVGTQFCASTRKNARSVMTKAAEERKKNPKDFLLGGGVISFSAKPEIKASNGGLFYVRDRGGVCFLTVAPFKMNGLMKTSCLRPEKRPSYSMSPCYRQHDRGAPTKEIPETD